VKRWTLLLMLVPSLALAGPLADAQNKLDAMDFDGALQQASQVLVAPGVQPSDLVDAYRIQGLCLSAAGKGEEARDAFRRALSINPELNLSTDTSPKLSAPFYQAKAIAREIKPIRLHHGDPGPRASGGDRQVEVKLEADPMRLVKGIHLCQHVDKADWRCGETTQVTEPGQFKFQLAPAAGDAPVTYYFEALTDKGGVLSRAGSRDKPFGKIGTPVAVLPPVGKGDTWAGETSEKKQAGIWYEQWWFWTAVGVVVAGTAVGLGVGLSGSSSDGTMDYQVSVE